MVRAAQGPNSTKSSSSYTNGTRREYCDVEYGGVLELCQREDAAVKWGDERAPRTGWGVESLSEKIST